MALIEAKACCVSYSSLFRDWRLPVRCDPWGPKSTKHSDLFRLAVVYLRRWMLWLSLLCAVLLVTAFMLAAASSGWTARVAWENTQQSMAAVWRSQVEECRFTKLRITVAKVWKNLRVNISVFLTKVAFVDLAVVSKPSFLLRHTWHCSYIAVVL